MIRRMQREIRRGRGSYCIVLSIAVGLLPWSAFGQTPTALVKQPPKKLQPLRGKDEKPAANDRKKGAADKGAALPAPAGDDWPMGGYDSGNAYYNVAEKKLTPPLVKIWEAKLADLRPERVAVSSGVVLAAGIQAPVTKNQVVAFDAHNGRRMWAFTLPGSHGSIETTPACFGGTAFFGGQQDDNLYAVDLRTGKVRWKHGEMKHMMNRPIRFADGLLYVNSPAGFWVLDPHTGKEKWHDNSGSGAHEIAIKAGKLLRPGYGAFDAVTGAPLWSNNLIANANQIAATDDLVFVAAKDRIAALAIADGKSVWETVPKADASHYEQFLLVGDALYAAPLAEAGSIYCLDAQTGKLQKERPFKANALYKWIAANNVIFASTDYDTVAITSKLVALSAETLQDKWSTTVPFSVWSMAVANGRLYVVGAGGAKGNWIWAFGNK